jgi:hypothetical protein
MLHAIARRRPWLTTIVLAFALVLLAPWHAAGAAPRSSVNFASPSGPEHRTDCPLLAPRAQAAPAQVPRAAFVPPEPTTDSALHDRAGFTADSAARAGVALRAAPVPSVPLYLLTLRLRR